MKKEIYTKPEIEIVEFSLEDIMTASSFDPFGVLDDNADNSSWWG